MAQLPAIRAIDSSPRSVQFVCFRRVGVRDSSQWLTAEATTERNLCFRLVKGSYAPAGHSLVDSLFASSALVRCRHLNHSLLSTPRHG